MPRPSRAASIGQKVLEVVDQVCGGSPETLVTALLDYRGLEAEELQRVRQLLEDAKATQAQKNNRRQKG